MKETKEKIDYLLRVNGVPRIAVEAKSIDQPILEAHAAQVIQYASILGVEWAVVTNAREWRLYHQFAQADLPGKHLFTLDLVGWTTDAQFNAVFEQLWLLSREAFIGSDGPAAWLRAQKLDSTLRDALTNPGSDETKYLRRRLEKQGIVATPEDVAAWFKARLLEPAPVLPESSLAEAAAPVLPGSPTGGAPVKALHKLAKDTGGSGSPTQPSYWVVPAASRPDRTAEQCLHDWLGAGMWGLGESTPGRKSVRAGDWMAFYVGGTTASVVAYGRVTGDPILLVALEEWPEPTLMGKPYYKVPLAEVTWLAHPVRIDSALRSALDAFKGREADGVWGWFVQTTRRLSSSDFLQLTGR